jgi:hypothetical protein
MKWLRQFKFIIQFANKIHYFLNGDFSGSKLIRLETKSTSGCPINEATKEESFMYGVLS